jgi:hypothetical protein
MVDTRELSRSSDGIVVGRVEAVRCFWNPERTRIFTEVTIRVDQSVKGSSEPLLTLTQLGGTIDGARYTVPGAPQFHVGEETLVFVWRDAKGRPQVNGMAQGKFEIDRDAKGVRRIQRTLPGFAVGDVRTLAPPRVGERTWIPLHDMLREIDLALGRVR